MASMPKALLAGFWGFVAGAALLLGAAAGYFAPVPRRVIGAIMGFGGGVLISALAFDLMDEAYRRGGFDSTSMGFLGGAIIYTGANWLLERRGAKHRKRSGKLQPTEKDHPGSGTAIIVGALIDGIPESIAIGVSLISGGRVSVAAVVAIFLSNIPEGLSASVGMKGAGRSARYIFGMHAAIVVVSAAAAVAGYVVFSRFSPDVIAATTAVAAGGILAMLSDTMMPEAFEEGHNMIGLVTVAGFLIAFVLTKLDH
jgi:zinc transporter, ZIP family